jgi:hypothetical protein
MTFFTASEDSVQRLQLFCMLTRAWQADDTEDVVASALEDFDPP